ncbi:MAG: lamin tail domain-containing protein [Candidatus Spechtbacterales bacterium]|nr:lamin tail domain-containing protein [Candidatus Spechtbacterales bacterium]
MTNCSACAIHDKIKEENMKKKGSCKICLASLVFVIIVILSLVLIINQARAEEGNSIVINEIAWMGTKTSTANEWIELRNLEDTDINLEGWVLVASDETPEIHLKGIIKANGFFLLERTDDSTVENVAADQIYTGALSNTGELLSLIDSSGFTVYEVNSTEGWQAGDNTTKATMELADTGLWQTGPIGGTPKVANSYSASSSDISRENAHTDPIDTLEEEILNPEPADEPSSDNEEPETIEQDKEDPIESNTLTENTESNESVAKTDDVIISEFIPNPIGRDSELEWIEIYNKGMDAHDLSGWQLDDEEKGSRPYIFPKNTEIESLSYFVLSIGTTGIQLNNQSDAVRLLYPDNSLAYSVQYEEKAEEGYAYAIFSENWEWTKTPTPGSKNILEIPSQKEEVSIVGTINSTDKDNAPKEDDKDSEVEPIKTERLSANISSAQNNQDAIPVQYIVGAFVSLLSGFIFIGFKKIITYKKSH